MRFLKYEHAYLQGWHGLEPDFNRRSALMIRGYNDGVLDRHHRTAERWDTACEEIPVSAEEMQFYRDAGWLGQPQFEHWAT